MSIVRFGATAVFLGGLLCTGSGAGEAGAEEGRVRFAQFNVWELNRPKLEEIDSGAGASPQLRKAAAILQHVRPDVLLVNEIDFDPGRRQNARLFEERYLGVSQGGLAPLGYPFVYFAPVNTGVPTGLDLDNDGERDGPGDAFGFGRYPGQYGMALYSRFPIDEDAVRTFRRLRWRAMPDHKMPDGKGGRPAWYEPNESVVLRLSSKSHWDVPIRILGTAVHVLCAHPPPPVFDGPEDRNGRRNFDEIRLLADYIVGGTSAAYIVDDRGARGGLAEGALFVVMGDMNADPTIDEAAYGVPAIDQLLGLPQVQDPAPVSAGAAEGPARGRFAGRRTAAFGRADYVLVSAGLAVVGKGVFWPGSGDPLRSLVEEPDPASDHHLVWADVLVPQGPTPE